MLRIRQRYNRWVANETLEDYALRFTATGARRWSSARVANTALGAISFLALEGIGGAVTLAYGFDNAVAAILAVSVLIFLTGLPICYYAARYGVDIDLLTRGAGFGYIGSTVTSLIYASFTFIFFALEAIILALALEMWLGLPLMAGYVLSALVVIPLVTYGVTVISRFQLWTQPVWVLLHLAPFLYLGVMQPDTFGDWTQMQGRSPVAGDGLNILAFGAATTVVASLVAQIGEQVDFLRFLPRYRPERRWAWWGSLLSAGPGWIVPGALKLLAGSYLVSLCLAAGTPVEDAAKPTEMYRLAFGRMIDSPAVAVAVAGIFVVLSQLKINVTNAYAGSIAWSNFFSRLTHSHPGRVVWLVFNVAIALILMMSGLYGALEQILGLYAVVAVAWVGALVADLVINKPLGLSPPHIEFKRAHLYDINPVGMGAMILAVAAAVLVYFGVLGETARAFSAFVAFGVALATAPLIAWATGGRFYLARQSDLGPVPEAGLECSICQHTFEAEDMAWCPAYGGHICSLCCTLDARCHDGCKPREARSGVLLPAFIRASMPSWLARPLTTRIGLLILGLAASLLVVGVILTLIYLQTAQEDGAARAAVAGALWMTFLVFALVAGVASLLFMLTRESRRTALEEAERQTALLMHEIEAHQRTDAKLQKAKDAAEAANVAKSRYMVGISHEIRAPLNAISGYAQLLARDRTIPSHRRDAIHVIHQSAQHLTGLVEGLLDISRIEAGHLELNDDEVHLADLLDQFADMFRMQAQAKGLTFIYDPPPSLPAVVHCDEKRLRQVLFNLLTNAVKFTETGHVALRLRMRSEVAEFVIEDTGAGIPATDLQRIFEPFERGAGTASRRVPGMGLGLTITRLLTEVMGGAVGVTSEEGRGSRFFVKLFLPEVSSPVPRQRYASPPQGYRGARRLLMVVDDEPSHRAMMLDVLQPLGFDVAVAGDAEICRRLVVEMRPDLFLIDISMPGGNGWDLAEDLRRGGFTATPIVMVSANAQEYRPRGQLGDLHDAFLVKPVDLSQLVETVGDLLRLEWIRADDTVDAEPREVEDLTPPADLPAALVTGLADAVAIGHVRGVAAALDAIEAVRPDAASWTAALRNLLTNFSLADLAEAVADVRAAASARSVTAQETCHEET
ncbi:ATP-binding protein [Rhodospira trueperi]|uniref:ATP-binding protein n=1 Tax=Rhodospira trueperi TaxID=69960 RepID=UPI001FDF3ACC|nr:ATP-binding protein [Rhodospira trueperi]